MKYYLNIDFISERTIKGKGLDSKKVGKKVLYFE